LTLLEEHVARFNEGVRTGDWSSMLELLADDAVLEFEGIPVGPFHGKDAVGAAYRAQPPDDEIVLLDGGPEYAWSRAPTVKAGELHVEERDGRIARLLVVYLRD
jgi:steroid Delta-isomerase